MASAICFAAVMTSCGGGIFFILIVYALCCVIFLFLIEGGGEHVRRSGYVIHFFRRPSLRYRRIEIGSRSVRVRLGERTLYSCLKSLVLY